MFANLDERQRTNGFLFEGIQGRKVGADHDAVSNREHNDHNSDDTSREAGDKPQNVYSRFEGTKELTTAKKYSEDSDSGVPELKYANCHIDCEKVEGSLVAVSDTCLGPHAVMVQTINAFSALAAM